MKILYITFLTLEDPLVIGVWRKVRWQIEALRKLGHEAVLGCYDGNDYIFEGLNECHRLEVRAAGCTMLRIRRKLITYDLISNHVEQEGYDAVYIRYTGFCDPWMLGLYKNIKSATGQLYLEVPTYPLNGELLGYIKSRNIQRLSFSLIVVVVSIICCKGLKKYVDGLVTYTRHDRIWGIPVTVIENGINVEEIPRVNYDSRSESDPLTITVVTMVFDWQGLDRVLAGLHSYYASGGTTGTIHFNVIGDGPALLGLKQLAQKLGLNESVTFTGVLRGKELDKIFDKTDIAIGTLGMHRKGLNEGSTLKIREYCARGVPFVYAYDERKMSDNIVFALKVSADDAPLDIRQVLDFHRRCSAVLELPEQMRSFAEEHYDWVSQMKKVF